MVQTRSILNVADNSGAKNLVVIGLGKGTGRRFCRLGDVATCVVRGASPTGQVKDHEKVKVVIVRTKKEVRRRDGSYVRFSDNAAVIIDANKNPRATRILGPIAAEVRDRKFTKIASLAKEVF